MASTLKAYLLFVAKLCSVSANLFNAALYKPCLRECGGVKRMKCVYVEVGTVNVCVYIFTIVLLDSVESGFVDVYVVRSEPG